MTESAPRADEGFDFSETAVLIAGGTSGVGLATAVAFAQTGCRRLMVLGRNEERGKRAVDHVLKLVPGASVEFCPADANDPASVQEAVGDVHRRLGGLDVLVNSTVVPYQPTLFHEIPLESAQKILVEQASGPILMSRAVVPIMREQGSGSIINISSDAARVPTPGEACLGAAMAAIVTFSRTLALEAKRYGVRVNAVTPSLIVDTGSYDRAMASGFSKKIFERITAQAHLGLTTPADLANLILFLASPLSRLITGQVVSVNGGISIA
jgi:NAD(P)-dependent dehydrogenase (short-subunit alcohol dehydrogenase family)